MAQIFHPSSRVVSRASIVAILLVAAVIVWVSAEAYVSPYYTRVNVPREQPIPFSHEHHVSGLGIRCQYCHTTADVSPRAGIPPTHTCMTCHSQVWTTAPMLAPVRTSYASNQPLTWIRVHDAQDFVYFNHSIHVAKGIGCQTCHGNVQSMPLVWKVNTLSMGWCLECHRAPERFVRPREDVYNMEYQPPANQDEVGRELVQLYNIKTKHLDDCSICHR
jgi:hypothetical protein